MTRFLGPPPLPHEHGAWAMLVLPLVVGLAAVGTPAAAGSPAAGQAGPAWLPALLVPPAMALLFMSRYAAVAAATRIVDGKKTPKGFIARRVLWAGIYIAGATVLFGVALRTAPEAARRHVAIAGAVTLGLGVLHTALVFAGRDRTIPGEIVGMLGLASAATLVITVAGRPLDRHAFGAGLLAFLYFCSSLAYVRAIRGLWKGDTRGRRRCIVAHVMIVGAAGQLAAGGFVPPVAVAAYVPVLARTIWGLLSPPPNLRTLGWREVGVVVAFALIAIAGYLLAG
jgi:YwiC-like protein